jgi:hypothetical protein
VLDATRKPASRPRSGRRAATGRRAEERGATYTGPYAAAGPYEDGGEAYEVRLERVPGGLRLAAWSGGSIRRAAPVLAATDLPGLLASAGERGVLDDGEDLSRAAAERIAGGASPGRAGELRDELRVEELEDGRVRIARWIMRPNAGWQLQEAPVMLPASRYAEALERGREGGLGRDQAPRP